MANVYPDPPQFELHGDLDDPVLPELLMAARADDIDSAAEIDAVTVAYPIGDRTA